MKKRTYLEKNYPIEVMGEEIKRLRENKTPLRFMSMTRNEITDRFIHVRLVTADNETSYLVSVGMEGSLEVCDRNVRTTVLSRGEFNKIKDSDQFYLQSVNTKHETKYVKLMRFKPRYTSYIITTKDPLIFMKEDKMHKEYRTIGLPLSKPRQHGDKMGEFERRVHEYIRTIFDKKQPTPEQIKWLQDAMDERGLEGMDYYYKNLPRIKLEGEALEFMKKVMKHIKEKYDLTDERIAEIKKKLDDVENK